MRTILMAFVMMVVFVLFGFIGGKALAENIPVEVVTAPMSTPMAVLPSPTPVKTVEEIKLTVKDESMVPPEWLQNAVISAKSLPVVGPVIVKSVQWLGVIVSILTALFAFLWVLLRSLQVVASSAKLAPLAEKLAQMENSKAMYYLKALSMFNAQKKDKPV